ncbi:expressed unknown protein [Seminavis robusta]|uniref:Uncharacterized protein n=1 Tax=Seminavis robusta TaxID=568900 RepID=A0A9N8E7L1_9STRA|nr:expressed unknown protein [Seminavis robusta]|eukprot:Sro628_g178140.1 n/a (345) ;mRNA; f:52869-53903
MRLHLHVQLVWPLFLLLPLLAQVHSLSSISCRSIQTRKSTLYSKDGKHVIGSLVERRDVHKARHEVILLSGADSSSSPTLLQLIIPFFDQADSVGSSIWPSCLAGAILLCHSPTLQRALHDKRILELGTGLGLGGLVAAAVTSPKACVLTDNDADLVQRLQDHIITTQQQESEQQTNDCDILAKQLDWRDDNNHDDDDDDDDGYDVVLGFDVAYYYHLVAPLVATARANLPPTKEKQLLLVLGQANRESQWQLYHHVRDGGYNPVTDLHEPPWSEVDSSTTKMLLYELQMQTWQDETVTEEEAPVDGNIPIAALLHTTEESLVMITPHDYVATEQDEEAQMMSF